jgi:3-hydroxyisobutyrate dehydrogenase-like beta-hydroxyacid dehydrogenase
MAVRQPPIGFVGLGTMGGPMARRLAEAGYPLHVCDKRTSATTPLVRLGARVARTPEKVADRAATVMVCLASVDQFREVACGRNGLLASANLRTIVNFTTTGSDFIAGVAAEAAKRGVVVIDCPITGGRVGATSGKLSISVSGPRKTYEQVEPLLGHLATRLFYVGRKAGQAQTMKLVNNLLSFIALAGTAEAFVLGVKAGLDPELMVEVINTGTGSNSATQAKFPRHILPRTFDWGSGMNIAWKDLTLCMREAEALGVTLWVGNTVRQVFGHAIAEGGFGQDITEVIKPMEVQAGVVVRGRPRRRRPAP